MSINYWQKLGVAIAQLSSDSPGQPTVIYEGNAVILSGIVFKMWFGTLNGICYAESSTGLPGSWTRYSGNPIVSTSDANPFPRLIKYNGIYYLYCNVAGIGGPIALYTATDGVTFSQASSSVLARSQAWESADFFGQLSVAGQDMNGTWWGYYTSYDTATSTYYVGQASSPDLVVWTKTASNPFITTGQPSNFTFQKVGSTWYGWSQIVLNNIPAYGTFSVPSDIARYSSSSPAGPWTILTFPASSQIVPTIYRTIAIDGVGSNTGQVGDPSILSDGTNLWMFYTNSPAGGGLDDTQYTIGVAKIANTSFTQLVGTYEGVYDVPFPSTVGLSKNIVQTALWNGTDLTQFTRLSYSSGVAAQVSGGAIESSVVGSPCDTYYSAQNFNNDQYFSVTAGTITAASSIGGLLRANTSNPASAYRLAWIGSASKFEIQLNNSGAVTTLYTITGSITAGDVIVGTVIGSTLSIYQNGNLMGTVTDTTLTSGYPGFLCNPNTSVGNAKISEWSGGNLVSSPPVPPMGSRRGTRSK